MKDANQDQPNEETQRERSGRVPNSKLLCPQDTFPSWHVHVHHQPRSSPELQCLRFLLGFYYVGVIDRIPVHMIELSLQPPPSPEEVRLLAHGSKAQPSNHVVGSSGVVSPHSE